MATFNHRRFANPDALKAIHPQHLLALLQPHALYLAGRRFVVPGAAIAEAIDHAGLLEVILTPDAQSPTDLTDAFYLVHQLGVREAFDELLAEADKAGIQLEPGPRTPEDVVAQLWLRDRSVLDRVLGRRVAEKRRTFDYFQGTGSRGAAWSKPSAETIAALERDMDGWFELNHRGRGSKVLVYDRGEGAAFVVRHGQPLKRVGSLHDGKATAFSYRPEKHDVVVYDPQLDELAVNADTKGEKQLYQRSFGKHLFGSETYFPGEGKYTLEPLRHAGPQSLACEDVPAIEWVKLRDLEYAWPGFSDEVVKRQSSDLLKLLSRPGKGIHRDARLRSAGFLIKFRGARHARMVSIRPSNVAEYARDADAEVVETWLTLRKFIRTEAA